MCIRIIRKDVLFLNTKHIIYPVEKATLRLLFCVLIEGSKHYGY